VKVGTILSTMQKSYKIKKTQLNRINLNRLRHSGSTESGLNL